MEYIKQQLKNLLSIPSPSGFTRKAADYIMDELKTLGYEPYMTTKGCVGVCLGGEGDPILLGAHVDTLGGMVAEIKGSGALRITNIGGLNANNVEAENCTIFTRDGRSYTGVCQLIDASIHVNKEYSDTKRTFNTVEVLIDEIVESKDDVKKLGISVGDYVCFDPRTTITESGFIKSRFLDDKLSAAILLGYAKRLKDANKAPARRVYLYFTVYEEVGHGGASGMPEGLNEIIAVDMGCVGHGLECEHLHQGFLRPQRLRADHPPYKRRKGRGRGLRRGYIPLLRFGHGRCASQRHRCRALRYRQRRVRLTWLRAHAHERRYRHAEAD